MHNPRPDIEICPQRDIENSPRALVAAAPQKKSEKSSPLKEILIVARPFKWSFILAGRKIDKKWKQNWAFYGRCILEAQGHFGCCCFHASCARCQINKAGQTSGGRGRWKWQILPFCFLSILFFAGFSHIWWRKGKAKEGGSIFPPSGELMFCLHERTYSKEQLMFSQLVHWPAWHCSHPLTLPWKTSTITITVITIITAIMTMTTTILTFTTSIMIITCSGSLFSFSRTFRVLRPLKLVSGVPSESIYYLGSNKGKVQKVFTDVLQ